MRGLGALWAGLPVKLLAANYLPPHGVPARVKVGNGCTATLHQDQHLLVGGARARTLRKCLRKAEKWNYSHTPNAWARFNVRGKGAAAAAAGGTGGGGRGGESSSKAATEQEEEEQEAEGAGEEEEEQEREQEGGGGGERGGTRGGGGEEEEDDGECLR